MAWRSELTAKRYTGQYHEAGLAGAEGLYYYNARWYDPALGRFVQTDTLVPQPGNPQALNRFAYVYGNPVKLTDPTGHIGDPDRDYRGNGNYNYYHLSSHRGYEQAWFQERSAWRFVPGASGPQWVKPSMADYRQWLHDETSRSATATWNAIVGSRYPDPGVLSARNDIAQDEGLYWTAAPPPTTLDAAPPLTYAGDRLVVEFEAQAVDWDDVAIDVAGLVTVGAANLANEARLREAAGRSNAALGGLQAGQSGTHILSGSAGLRDFLQFGLAFGGQYPHPVVQIASSALSLLIDLGAGLHMHSEEVWR